MYTEFWKLIDKTRNQKIMVVGDMVADVYLEGKISRISREAPVLILEHLSDEVVPGGAANAVHNAATLGGLIYAVGVVGQDNAGEQLTKVLQSKKVNTEGLIVDCTRSTITKTRVMAGGQATVRQQIVRIDRESKEPLAKHIEQSIVEYISCCIPKVAAVVISDYGSYTITPKIRQHVIDSCNRAGIPCVVDSRYDILAYRGVTVVKQNESEAASAVGYEIVDEASLLRAGQSLLERLEAQAVLVTRGPDGMTLFECGAQYTHIPVVNKTAVYDVTGAGDTVVAMMVLALVAGASYIDAARLANFAAGVVVKKIGTATTTPEELCETIGVHYENC